MRRRNLLYLLLLICVIAAGQGLAPQAGACQVSTSDLVFAPGSSAQGPQFNYPVSTPLFGQYGPATFFRETRVVGPGLPSEFVSGAPGQVQAANWAIYQQNGVVSSTAWVEVSTSMVIEEPQFWQFTHADGSNGPVSVSGNVIFTLNGVQITQPIGFNVTVTSSTQLSSLPVQLCVPINAQLLRFATRLIDPSSNAAIPCADQQSGETTCPGINEVEAFQQTNYGQSVDFVSGATRIIFRAMAPVVMIHGWRSNPQFFATGSTANGSPAFLQPFETPFLTGKIPYDRTMTILNTLSLQDGRDAVAAALKPILAKFGAKECHLIAHSKGALWTRGALPKWQDQDIGVLSFTTLDAPNRGAFLADFMQYGRQYSLQSADIRNLFGLLTSFALLKGAEDLTRDGVAQFNLNTADPPVDYTVDGVVYPVTYYSIASDADIDGNGAIGIAGYQGTTIDEASPYPLGDALWNLTWKITGHFDLINPNRTFSLGHWEFQAPQWKPFSTFQTNDLIVVAAEAASYVRLGGNQQEVFTLIPVGNYMKHNHNTVGRGDTGQAVLAAIQSAQPVQ